MRERRYGGPNRLLPARRGRIDTVAGSKGIISLSFLFLFSRTGQPVRSHPLMKLFFDRLDIFSDATDEINTLVLLFLQHVYHIDSVHGTIFSFIAPQAQLEESANDRGEAGGAL